MGTSSKGGGGYSPPAFTPPADNSAIFQSTLDNYQRNMENMIQQSQLGFEQQLSALSQNTPDVPSYESSLPTIIGSEAANMDWAAKNEELKKKMQADFALEQAKRQSAMSTIITSPLLDEEDPTTTGSILR